MKRKFFSENRIRLLLTFGTCGVLLLAISVVYALLVGGAEESGEKLFECAFQEVFPLYCPGCGGSRSLYYLMRLDIVKSFIYYPALPVAALILIDLYIRAIISFVKDDPLYIKKFRLNILLIIPIIILLNFAIRNILLHLGIDYIGDFSG